MQEALGIPSSGYEYMKMPQNHDGLEERLIEFDKMRTFLANVAKSNTIPEFQGENKSIQFINYGDTEMVYVLTVGDRKYTMLIGQPATEFGVVKREYENLQTLGKNNKSDIVIPMYYLDDKKEQQELYITPYLYQARCIGVEEKEWGNWVPEPYYHFRDFTSSERSIINSSMIAMLIKLFDSKNNLGIGACKIGGGDFVLEKGFEDEQITYENILKRMKLIAARELIPITLDEYIRKIKDEFSRRTYYRLEQERDKSILINYKCRAPMPLEDIQNGIELGCKLREEKQVEKDG